MCFSWNYAHPTDILWVFSQSCVLETIGWFWGAQPGHSGSELDCRLTGQGIDHTLGHDWYKNIYIKKKKKKKIVLSSPGCPRPSIALQCKIMDTIHLFICWFYHCNTWIRIVFICNFDFQSPFNVHFIVEMHGTFTSSSINSHYQHITLTPKIDGLTQNRGRFYYSKPSPLPPSIKWI